MPMEKLFHFPKHNMVLGLKYCIKFKKIPPHHEDEAVELISGYKYRHSGLGLMIILERFADSYEIVRKKRRSAYQASVYVGFAEKISGRFRIYASTI